MKNVFNSKDEFSKNSVDTRFGKNTRIVKVNGNKNENKFISNKKPVKISFVESKSDGDSEK